MNEKLQYASMLEIPVNTCQITKLTHRKRKSAKKRRINDEKIKAELLKKVNAEQDLSERTKIEEVDSVNLDKNLEEPVQELENQQPTSIVHSSKPKNKKKFKVSVVGVQLAIIGALVMAIFLTNAFYADSGINVFLRGVFGSESTTTDLREFDQFSPVINMGNNQGIELNEGIISFSGEGSVYSPCDGKVSKITKSENGKFDIEIEHSQNFKSLISDVEHVYVAEGDSVFSNIPVGYLKADGASICFTNSSGIVFDDYEIVDNMVVWQA